MEMLGFYKEYVKRVERAENLNLPSRAEEGMRLMDGSVIEVWPKKNEVTVDCAETRQLLIDNSFLYLANAEKILGDSKMFLAPLCKDNPHFQPYPTLGVFVEWWLNSTDAVVEMDGEKWLVLFFVGSPFSGNNSTTIVNRHGVTKQIKHPSFASLRRSFTKVSNRYAAFKATSESYSLAEATTILKDAGTNAIDTIAMDMMLDNIYLRGRLKVREKELAYSREQSAQWEEKWRIAKIQSNKKVLSELMAQYHAEKEKDAALIAERLSEKKALDKRRKFGSLSNSEYQKLAGPINREIRDLKYKHYAIEGHPLIDEMRPHAIFDPSWLEGYLEFMRE